ncbi:purine-cytosine permease family protein [Brevibacterium sp. CFH 10365]|uniref:purine-cytosine permease family protein n=1 Tax=Brevibacterium sp. CFH 10365 TaxID=2585207 RepID=UPI00187969FF|nr:cytosine permease [Brevibacterium sp. CFH 10365]
MTTEWSADRPNELTAAHRVASTPGLVEINGVEPVAQSQRNVSGWNLFQILVNTLLNPGLMLIGGLAVISGLTPVQAVAATLLGISVAFGAYIVLATVGVDYGIPGIVSTRGFLGIVASKWVVSVIRALSAAFWFAVQTTAGAIGIIAAFDGLTGVRMNFIAVCVVFGMLQLAVAVMGYGSLSWLSQIAFPVKLIGLPIIAIALLNASGEGMAQVFSFNAQSPSQWIVFLVTVNTVAVTWLGQATDAADYCRYTKSRRAMWWSTAGAAIIGAGLSAMFGAFGAAVSQGKSGNTFEVAGGSDVGSIVLVIILVVLVLENWTINVLNLYTGGLALANLIPRAGRIASTMAVGLAGIVLSCLPDLANRFTDIVSASGLVFAPLTGVMIADYLVIKRGSIDISQLFEPNGIYRYLHGVNIHAVCWTAVGAIVYIALPDQFLPALVTMSIAIVGYAISAPRPATAPTSIVHRPSTNSATS